MPTLLVVQVPLPHDLDRAWEQRLRPPDDAHERKRLAPIHDLREALDDAQLEAGRREHHVTDMNFPPATIRDNLAHNTSQPSRNLRAHHERIPHAEHHPDIRHARVRTSTRRALQSLKLLQHETTQTGTRTDCQTPTDARTSQIRPATAATTGTVTVFPSCLYRCVSANGNSKSSG